MGKYLDSFDFPEEERNLMAQKVFKSQTWNERDRGLFSEEEYVEQFIKALPQYKEDVKKSAGWLRKNNFSKRLCGNLDQLPEKQGLSSVYFV